MSNKTMKASHPVEFKTPTHVVTVALYEGLKTLWAITIVDLVTGHTDTRIAGTGKREAIKNARALVAELTR